MSNSILTSTKKILGLAESYKEFDLDIIMHINSVFSTLHQLGIGPALGFEIEDDGDEWDDFVSDDLPLNNVKSYVFLRVKLLFDPPSTSYHLTAMENQIRELEWRMNVYREGTAWVDPDVDETVPI